MIKRFAAGPSLVIPGSGGKAAPSPGAARRPTSGGGRSSGGGGSSDATKDAVRTMQQLMSQLNTDLQKDEHSSKALAAITSANGGTPPELYKAKEDIARVAQSWGNTAGRQAFDGIWGPKTKAQLESIKKFISDTKLPGLLIQVGTGSSPYKEMKDSDVKKSAEDNIINLSRLFTSIGLSAPAAATRRGGSGFVLDQVPQQLTTAAATTPNPWPESWGDIPVTVGDLKSLSRFFMFIQGLQHTPCKPLEGSDRGKEETKSKKEEIDLGYAHDEDMDDLDVFAENLPIFSESLESLADFILDSSLIRLAAGGPEGGVATSAQPAAKPEAEKPVAEPAKTEEGGMNWHCFYTVDDILKWFASRARMVMAQIGSFAEQAKPHPAPTREGTAISDQDKAAAQAYLAAVTGLWEQWSRIKGNVLKQIQDKGAVDHPQVTLDMIMQSGAGSLPTPGAARRYPGGRGGQGGGSSTIPGSETAKEWVLRGPIQRQMPLNWLLREDAFNSADFSGVKRDQLAAASANGQLPTNLDRDEWRGGNWVNIALTNIKGNSNTEKLRNFPKWAGLVRDALYELYGGWEARYRNDLDRPVIAQQSREISRWGDVITSIITRAQYGMDEAIGMYGR